MATKKRKKPTGDHFSWDPVSFEFAKQQVEMARSGAPPIGAALAQMMPHAIRTMGPLMDVGGLTCPAPADDPHGVYRVGLDDAGRPQIQRRDALGVWQPVP
jgi:hypothetical protein